MICNVLSLGQCSYEKALAIQYDLLEKRTRGEIGDTLILVEHPPVITLGRRAVSSHVTVSEDYLKQQGVEIYRTNRGGDVTYHGNGQLVGYPIVDIRGMGIRTFVQNLEQIFIQLLKEKYGIEAHRHPTHTGVWVGEEKIVAIGLAVKRGITMHGFALNVNTHLDHFRWIIPCGIADRGVTSIKKELGEDVDWEDIQQWVMEYFCKTFGYGEYEKIDPKEGEICIQIG